MHTIFGLSLTSSWKSSLSQSVAYETFFPPFAYSTSNNNSCHWLKRTYFFFDAITASSAIRCIDEQTKMSVCLIYVFSLIAMFPWFACWEQFEPKLEKISIFTPWSDGLCKETKCENKIKVTNSLGWWMLKHLSRSRDCKS